MSIIYILGGPGAGKGTICTALSTKYTICHLSIGDLLRAEEQNPESPYAELIKYNLAHGLLGPKEMTTDIIRDAITREVAKSDVMAFLVDGFPRSMDRLKLFEESVKPADLAIFLDCEEDVRKVRLRERAECEGGGRKDDNDVSIRKRVDTFNGPGMEVVEYLENMGRLVRVDASRSVDEVVVDVEKVLESKLQMTLKVRDMVEANS